MLRIVEEIGHACIRHLTSAEVSINVLHFVSCVKSILKLFIQLFSEAHCLCCQTNFIQFIDVTCRYLIKSCSTSNCGVQLFELSCIAR